MTTTQKEEKVVSPRPLQPEDFPSEVLHEQAMALLAVLEWEGRVKKCRAA